MLFPRNARLPVTMIVVLNFHPVHMYTNCLDTPLGQAPHALGYDYKVQWNSANYY